MKDGAVLNSSASSRLAEKLDYMNPNQGRTFGPLLSLFLLNFLTKAVTAKYASFLPFQLPYDPSPWMAYNNKPLASYQANSPHWYPVKDPFQHEAYQTHSTLTPATPHFSDPDPGYDYHYPSYAYPTSDGLIPAESNNIPTSTDHNDFTTTTEHPYKFEEPEPAESRHPTQRYKKRGPTRRYSQKRRRTTTPYPDYYDSYEDFEPVREPSRRRTTTADYYDDEDNYYDYESTTRPYRRRRRPTRPKIQQPVTQLPYQLQPAVTQSPFQLQPAVTQNALPVQPAVTQNAFPLQSALTQNPFPSEQFNPNTEIVIVRQATTTQPTTTTTTEPNTVITNTTIPPQTTTTPTNTTGGSNATYGYGPSNGNENISFTYGPPVTKYHYSQYSVPYFDWYTQEATRNAIVKRVRDIVAFDRKFNLK